MQHQPNKGFSGRIAITTNDSTTILLIVGGNVDGKRERVYKRALIKLRFLEKSKTSNIDVAH